MDSSATEDFRRVAKEMDSVLLCALAREREYVCEAGLFLFTPYAPNIKGAALPVALPEGSLAAFGLPRASPRILEDAGCVEPSLLPRVRCVLWVCD